MEAVCLKTVDYREKDKLLTLLSAEGKFTARVRSVRKPNAKLSMAAQPFCVGEYTLNGKGDFFTVIGAEPKENFFRFWEDVSCYAAASVVTTVAEGITETAGDARAETALTIKSLSAIAYGESAPGAAVLWFLANAALLVGADWETASDRHKKLFSGIARLKWDEIGTMELTEGEVRILIRKCMENLHDFLSNPKAVYNALKLMDAQSN